jgi:hypothetical protein
MWCPWLPLALLVDCAPTPAEGSAFQRELSAEFIVLEFSKWNFSVDT